jgi:hypothetical protein
MHNLTIVYRDGYEEKYFIPRETTTPENLASNLKSIVENGIFKLVISNKQVVLIPFSTIRKIIYQPANREYMREKHYPGFIYVEPDDS